MVDVMAVRARTAGARRLFGFKLKKPDLPWTKFVYALQSGTTHGDLENATRFLPQ